MTQDFYSIQNYSVNTGVSQGVDYDIVNNVRRKGTSEKEQLKKLSIEFEAILVSKMFSQMDKSVDREGSLFGQSKYMDNFKSILFNQIGRDVANSPTSNIGFAKQLYKQMERSVSRGELESRDERVESAPVDRRRRTIESVNEQA